MQIMKRSRRYRVKSGLRRYIRHGDVATPSVAISTTAVRGRRRTSSAVSEGTSTHQAHEHENSG